MKNLFAFISLITALHGTALHADSDYPFKRVFTTEAERDILDKIRLDPTATEASTQINATATTPTTPTAPKVRFSGVHIGANGKHIVWVDGKSKLSKTPPSNDVKTSPPAKTTGKARIHTDGKSTLLKPGQVWLINSNDVQEGYEIKAPQTKAQTPKPTPSNEVPDVIKTIQALKEINAQ